MDKQQIVQALEKGLKVFWINSAYKVFLDNGVLYEINLYNDSTCKLQPSQYSQCFVDS